MGDGSNTYRIQTSRAALGHVSVGLLVVIWHATYGDRSSHWAAGLPGILTWPSSAPCVLWW